MSNISLQTTDASRLITGTLPAARLPTNTRRSTTAREIMLYDECFSASGPIGWQSSLAGGSLVGITTPDNARFGVLRFSTGTAASANQRGAAHTGAPASVPPIMLGGAYHELGWSAAPSLALFSGSLGGSILVGFAAGVALPTDGVYFRTTDGGNWFATTREAGVETATDTGIAPVLNDWRTFRIEVEADLSAVLFYIGASLVATHTTNIPIATRGLSHLISVNRTSATGTSVGLDVDWFYTRRVLGAARW